MAIEIITSGSDANRLGGNTLSFPLGPDIRDGDLALVVWSQDMAVWSGFTSSHPATITHESADIGDGQGVLISVPLSASDANTSLSFTTQSNTAKSMSVVVLRGAGIDVWSSWYSATANTAHTIPGLTTTAELTEHFVFYATEDRHNPTIPAGHTLLADSPTGTYDKFRTEIIKRDSPYTTVSTIPDFSGSGTLSGGKAVWRVAFEPVSVSISVTVDLDTPTVTGQSHEATVEAITNPDTAVDLDTLTMTMAAVDPIIDASTGVDLTTANVTTGANDVTVDVQVLHIATVTPTQDFRFDQYGTMVTGENPIQVSGYATASPGYFLFDIPSEIKQEGLVKVEFGVVVASASGDASTAQYRLITELGTGNLQDSVVSDPTPLAFDFGVYVYNDIPAGIDLENFEGIKVEAPFAGLNIYSSEDATNKPVLRLTYQIVPESEEIDLDTPSATLAANEPTIDTIDPVDEEVVLATAEVTATAHDAGFTEIRSVVLEPYYDTHYDPTTKTYISDSPTLHVSYEAGNGMPGSAKNGFARMYFAELPGSVLTGSVVEATLRIRTETNTYNNEFQIQTQYDRNGIVSSKMPNTVVSYLPVGTNNVDISSILHLDRFNTISVSRHGAQPQSMSFTSLDGAYQHKPQLTVRYQVNHGAVVVDLSTANATVAAHEAEAEGYISPDAEVVLSTAVIVIPEPVADVVLHEYINLDDTNAIVFATNEPEVEVRNNAVMEMDTPRILTNIVRVTDVNGEPVLPSETEDPYYKVTMNTLDGRVPAASGGTFNPEGPMPIERQVWFRMNENSGDVARDRIYKEYPDGTKDGQKQLTLNNVTVGMQDGPEGRHHFRFNGDSFAQEQGDEAYYDMSALEFTFRTTKKTQFIMGNFDERWGFLSNGVGVMWELWMVDGVLEVRLWHWQGERADQPWQNTVVKGRTDVADGNWHHLVLQNLDDKYGAFRFEMTIDAQLEMRKRADGFIIGVAGFPDFIGGRNTEWYGASRAQGSLSQTHWYVGDMTELVYRSGRTLSADEIARQRDAMMGIDAYWPTAPQVRLEAPNAIVKGNTPRMLVIDFGAPTDVDARSVKFNLEQNAWNVLNSSPATIDPLGTPMGVQVNTGVPMAFVGLGDEVTHFGRRPDNGLVQKFYISALSPDGRREQNANMWQYRTDDITGNYRLLDLDIDINMEDYDIISIVGFPGNALGRRPYERMDELNLAPYTPGLVQLENLLAQIRDQVIFRRKSLFIADPFSAVGLGIIDQVDVVPEAYEMAPPKFLDGRVGANNPGFDGHAFAIDPFDGPNGGATLGQIGAKYGNSTDMRIKAAGRYTDLHGINKQRVRAKIRGLTDIPSYIKYDSIEWMNVNPVNSPWAQTSIRYENRMGGLNIGDEFYIDMPMGVRGDTLGIQTSSAFQATKAYGFRVAAPTSAIKVGTAVTTFLPYHHTGIEEAVDAYRPADERMEGTYRKGNPFGDHALSIAVQPGDMWNGSIVSGKVYVNFTESLQFEAEETSTGWRMAWEHLDPEVDKSDALSIGMTIRYSDGGTFTIEPRHAYWTFSTHWGSWGGTEIVLDKRTKPDWGWSAGGVRGSGLSGGGGHAFNHTWSTPFERIEFPVLTMSQRGLRWLASELDTGGNVGVNLIEDAPMTTQAHDVVVETTSNSEVGVATARVNVESHTDADTFDPNAVVLASVGTMTLKASGINTEIRLGTAQVSISAQEPEQAELEVDWSEAIVLTLPRQIAILILEDN